MKDQFRQFLISRLMKSTRNNEWLKMYPDVPFEVGLTHIESHPEKLDKEKSTIEYNIAAAASRYLLTVRAPALTALS